jgi:hypothetical protein
MLDLAIIRIANRTDLKLGVAKINIKNLDFSYIK